MNEFMSGCMDDECLVHACMRVHVPAMNAGGVDASLRVRHRGGGVHGPRDQGHEGASVSS
jgi:hypothetical protein